MSNMWSQEEIDALLSGGGAASENDDAGVAETDVDVAENLGTIPTEDYLTQSEIDTLGELANICMGASATALYAIFDRRVTITTPRVQIFPDLKTMLRAYDRPFVAVQVSYTEGFSGNNILLLKETDAMSITDLMMGGDGLEVTETELGELQLSALSEAMNQMVGASATALSNMVRIPVNISPPVTALVQISEEEEAPFLDTTGEPIVRINFDMEIEGVLKSKIMQVMPVQFAKDLADQLFTIMEQDSASPPYDEPTVRETAPASPPPAPAPQTAYVAPPSPLAPSYAPPMQTQQRVDVQPVQYPSFDAESGVASGPYSENIGIVIDVPLQVTVELGKTKKSIKEILDIGKGSIVVLDKLAGEMVEVLANGKLIARGEVVVIDDNYGVRITEVIAAHKRQENPQ